LLVQQRFIVQYGFKIADLEVRRRFHVQRGNHPDELFVAERSNHPRAALRKLARAHRVGKGAVQRNGQRDFAADGHGRQLPV